MAVSYDMTNALREQEHGHPPLVLVYESHGQDCRYKPLGEVCSTISQKYGTGGGNAPIVVEYETDRSAAIRYNAGDQRQELFSSEMGKRMSSTCQRSSSAGGGDPGEK